jgi:hypothetical protein
MIPRYKKYSQKLGYLTFGDGIFLLPRSKDRDLLEYFKTLSIANGNSLSIVPYKGAKLDKLVTEHLVYHKD